MGVLECVISGTWQLVRRLISGSDLLTAGLIFYLIMPEHADEDFQLPVEFLRN